MVPLLYPVLDRHADSPCYFRRHRTVRSDTYCAVDKPLSRLKPFRDVVVRSRKADLTTCLSSLALVAGGPSDPSRVLYDPSQPTNSILLRQSFNSDQCE